jgi:hypothetical protein
MTNIIDDTSPSKAARIAGFGYLIIIILGIFAEFFVRSSLVVPGDAVTTANNIMANELLFRIGICSYLIMATFDMVVALALYILLKPVNKSLSLLAALFRLVHATILGIALYNLFSVLQLLSGADYLTTLETDQLYAQMMLFLNAFSYGWLIGLVFFGLHCYVLGYLIVKSGYIPKILGVLLIVASFGYLIDSFAHFLLSNYTNYEAIFLLVVAVPAIIAEVALCLWLLLKGIKLQHTQ